MPLSIDTSSPLPLYYQIRESLRKQILSGELQPGDALPGETQICAETGVSRMTARQALTQLANEGLVIRQRGRGTFVAAPKATFPTMPVGGMSYSEIISQLGMTAGAEMLSQEIIPASQEVASQLKLAAGTQVIRIVRRRSASGVIMSLETGFYTYERFPVLSKSDLTNTSIYQTIEKQYGVSPAYALDTIEISVAGPYEAERLKIKEGSPIALVTTLACLPDDTPIAFTQTIHRGDRFRSTIRRSHRQLVR
jgi:GntR family transcriptional regulator